ncbi:MoaD/ThiS family protein [Blastomonas sp. SL216]|uniref:MoaD/ThiS family protein n=1 Tax=Blastomonas sp. SL216 TaxID=2995169 RepID=UPI00237768FF|nr:MoaD/ThiS family protein [Blastomonas sp. SL216]
MAKLLFFGRLGDLAGGIERTLDLSHPHSVRELIAVLEASDPLLGSALLESRVRYALGGMIVDAEALVEQDDELAFLPPVSGG